MNQYSVLDVVPHDAPMSLLDSIASYDDEALTASVKIREDSQFIRPEGVPAWVGIEYMGQAIAAFAGVQARDKGQAVKIGFLVSSRRYKSSVSHFECGTELRIHVVQVTDNTVGLRVFQCRISGEGVDVSANLNVYMPDDVEAFLSGTQKEST